MAFRSRLDVTLKPISLKSMFTGVAAFRNSLSAMYLKPPISKIVSVFLASSRANANEGPAHPPLVKKTLTGISALPVKYSAICFLADSVTSIIIKSLLCICNYDSNVIIVIALSIQEYSYRNIHQFLRRHQYFLSEKTTTLCSIASAISVIFISPDVADPASNTLIISCHLCAFGRISVR